MLLIPMNYEAASAYILKRLKEELPDYCHYHDFNHTMSVLSAAELFANKEGINDEETLNLIRTAALYHDIGFIYQYKLNEPVAADIARKTLPGFGYTESQIETIVRMILVTALPAVPTDILESIIKDADFDYLGGSDYPEISLRLKAEWEHVGMHFNDADWYKLQQNFLETHTYFTAAARELREPVKQAHLIKVREIVKAA
jgi:uncharacterized protein